MVDELPQEYDVIVVGTGMVESILAAACARIGKSVLHIDTNDFYGSDWASFTLDNLMVWCDTEAKPPIALTSSNENERILPVDDPLNVFHNRQMKWNIEKSSDDTSTSEGQITVEMLKKESRKFNIDLSPKLFYGSGGLIDLLVQSNVGKYCEFKLVSRLLFENDGQLDIVPSSRADIFNSNKISLVDKRLLMKVIMNCSATNTEDFHEDENLPFIEYLRKQKLNDHLCHLILNSIAMVDYTATTKEGLIKAKRYLESVGRYGNSPFLYQMYGSGEMSQCFSRLCSVFGGIYYLRFPLAGFVEDTSNKRCTGIISTDGKQLHAKDMVVCNHSFLPKSMAKIDSTTTLHRTVLITNQSIKASDKEEITYLRLSSPTESGIHVIEVGHATGCAPEGYFLLYLFQEKSIQHSEKNLDWIVERLLQATEGQFTRTNILGQFTFDHMQVNDTFSPLSKLLITPGADGSIDHDRAVTAARTLFQQIYSNGEEFLPRAPDPEDIIIEDAPNTDQNSDEQTS